MWWNYKKPRPLKIGAFKLAATNNAPILPCFITMEDTNNLASNGSIIQAHTIHFLEPIYPDNTKTPKENAKEMMEKNYNSWVKVYEKTYHKKLEYLK